MEQLSYYELKQFNITKIMNKEYSEKKTLAHLNEFLSAVDFAEHSEVSFVYYFKDEHRERQEHMIRKESLGENVVDVLPFKAYENYITYKWLKIDEDKNSRFVYHGFSNYGVELIDKLGDLGFEAYKNKEMTPHEFHRLYLESSLKFSTIFNKYHHQEHRAGTFHNEFYPVFLKALSYYKSICETEYNRTTKVKNWLIDLPSLEYSSKEKKEEVIDRFRSIISYPTATLFLDSAFNQLKFISNVPGIKDKADFLLNNNFIELALEKGNTHFLTKVKEFQLSEKEILYSYETLLSSIYEKSNKSPMHIQSESNKLKNASQSFKWFKNEKIEKNLELLILSDSHEIKDYVKNNLDIHKAVFKLNETQFTTHDLIILSELSEEIETEFLKKTPKMPPLFLQVGSALRQNGFTADYKNTTQSDIKDKLDIALQLIIRSVKENDRENIDLPEIEQWFTQKYLDKKLECSSQSIPKIKI